MFFPSFFNYIHTNYWWFAIPAIPADTGIPGAVIAVVATAACVVDAITCPVDDDVVDAYAVGMIVDVGVSVVDDDSDDGDVLNKYDSASYLIKFLVHVYL